VNRPLVVVDGYGDAMKRIQREDSVHLVARPQVRNVGLPVLLEDTNDWLTNPANDKHHDPRYRYVADQRGLWRRVGGVIVAGLLM